MVPSPFSFTRARLIAKAQRILDAGSFAVCGTPGRAGAGAPARACPASKRALGRADGSGRASPHARAARPTNLARRAPTRALLWRGARRRPRARPPRHRTALGQGPPAGRGEARRCAVAPVAGRIPPAGTGRVRFACAPGAVCVLLAGRGACASLAPLVPVAGCSSCGTGRMRCAVASSAGRDSPSPARSTPDGEF